MNKNLLIFLGGVATGAALGILLAPDSGKNTRSKISYQLDRLLQQLKQISSTMETSATGADKGLTQQQSKDFHHAEELLKEVEGLLSDIRNRSEA